MHFQHEEIPSTIPCFELEAVVCMAVPEARSPVWEISYPPEMVVKSTCKPVLNPQTSSFSLIAFVRPAGELDMKEFVGGLLQLWLMDAAWHAFSVRNSSRPQ